MFVRIATDPVYAKYEPTIHSMPSPPAGSDIPDGPWVITLENVMTEQECDALIELGTESGYKQSQDVGKKKFDGTFEAYTNDRRTSTNAWCQED